MELNPKENAARGSGRQGATAPNSNSNQSIGTKRIQQQSLAELLALLESDTQPETIPSGLEFFDAVQPFGAVERGAKIVLSAPPGCFKTATMLRLARGFAEQGRRVAWLAAEMQPRILVRRMQLQLAGVNPSGSQSGPDEATCQGRLDDARQKLRAVGGHIWFESSPIDFEALRRSAGEAEVVFLDYIQLVRHARNDLAGHERIEEAMNLVAEVAQATGAVFIMASAQGRDHSGASRTVGNATRGSSAIEFTVDALYCAAETKRTKSKFSVVFKCLKQREGPQFPIKVSIDGATGLIAEGGE